MLTIKDLDSGYGKKQVLHGVSLDVEPGEIVALIGPNGAGKSTILKVIQGLLPMWRGQIYLQGHSLAAIGSEERVSRGITFAPQGRRVFAGLTVWENLEIAGLGMARNEIRDRIKGILEFFPVIKERQTHAASCLSGGEQQMVALGRALVRRPKLLMLDEPSLGLSPNLVRRVFEKIAEVNQTTGVTVLIVEQKVREVMRLCHRVYGLKLGRVCFKGLPRDLQEQPQVLRSIFL